jgi:hypothetical protein
LFSDPAALRELYEALEDVTVDPAIPITINTLSGVFYMEQYNDISFTIGAKLVVLIEHQSTVNRNMPLRLLLYKANKGKNTRSSLFLSFLLCLRGAYSSWFFCSRQTPLIQSGMDAGRKRWRWKKR